MLGPNWDWRKVCAAYGLRMQIGELFQDHKDPRYGWRLRQTELSEPERLERLLLWLSHKSKHRDPKNIIPSRSILQLDLGTMDPVPHGRKRNVKYPGIGSTVVSYLGR